MKEYTVQEAFALAIKTDMKMVQRALNVIQMLGDEPLPEDDVRGLVDDVVAPLIKSYYVVEEVCNAIGIKKIDEDTLVSIMAAVHNGMSKAENIRIESCRGNQAKSKLEDLKQRQEKGEIDSIRAYSIDGSGDIEDFLKDKPKKESTEQDIEKDEPISIDELRRKFMNGE